MSAYHQVNDDVFRTLGIPLRAGRVFTERDTASAPPVVIISETLARQHFPNENPIGQFIQSYMGSRRMEDPQSRDKPREVVGVVGDVRQRMRQSVRRGAAMYVPYHQYLEVPGNANLAFRKQLVIRTVGDPMGLAERVRQVVREVDPDQAPFSVRTVEESLWQATGAERFWVQVFGLFASLTLFLAAVGLYGVVAFTVSLRTHEFGVRTALGAQRGDILRLVLREALRMTVIGVAIGIVGSWWLARLIENQLYGVTPTDPLTLATVTVVLLAVAMLASYIPARRAARADPLVALRSE